MAAPTTSTGAPLVSRPFVLVTVSTFALFISVGINLPMLPRFIEDELGGGSFAVGLTLAVLSVAAIAARPVIGPLGDRRGRRVLMLGGAAMCAVGTSLQGTSGTLAVLIVLRAVIGVGEAAHFVGAATIVNDIAPPHRRAEAASLFSVAVFGGLGLGPVLGDELARSGRFDLGFVIAGACAAVAFAVALAVPGDARVHVHHEPPPMFHRKALWPGIVLALAMSGYAVWSGFLPLRADEIGGVGAGVVFLVYSVLVGTIRLAGARLPERIGIARCAAGALALISTGLAVCGLANGSVGLVAGTIVLGLGISLMYPSLNAIAVNGVADNERTSVVSSFTMFFEVGGAAGGIAFGALAAATSYQGAFIGGALAALVGLPVLWTRVIVPRRASLGLSTGLTEVIPSVFSRVNREC